MNRSVSPIEENDLPAIYGILTICGEAMHRTQGLNHWYPFRSYDIFKPEVAEATVYAIYEDDLLVGTFYLIGKPRAWYSAAQWTNPEAQALYFGGFGILPFMQGRGIGLWAMQEMERLARQENCEALRFSAAAHNEPLLRFYEKLGYEQRGFAEKPRSSVFFEKLFGP